MWTTVIRVEHALVLISTPCIWVSMVPLHALTGKASIAVNTICIESTPAFILAFIHILTTKCRLEMVNVETFWTLTFIGPFTIYTFGIWTTNVWL
jgi:hypothetical protein